MEKFTGHGRSLDAEEIDQTPGELKNLLTEEATEYVSKVNASKILALKEVLANETCNDPKFLGCLSLFLKWLHHYPAEELKHAQSTKKEQGKVRVLEASELAGMTATRMLLELIDILDLDWNKHTQVLELLRLELVGKRAFSEDDVARLIQGLTVYIRFKRSHLNSYSEISPR